MRGKLSDSDLTNYALNDGLDECERLYVESLMAASEECRQDVCSMIEVAQMLEEGFDGEGDRRPAALTLEQRNRLLNLRQRHPAVGFFRRAAAAVALAACVALAIASPQIRRSGAPAARKMAHQVSNTVSQMVSSSVGGAGQDVDFSSLVDFRFDDSPSWLQTANDTLPAVETVCTPPSWPDAPMH